MAGLVPVVFGSVSDGLAMVNAGRIRALAVSSATRTPALPQVPTFAELGYRNLVIEVGLGIYAPAKTPAGVVAKLNAAIQKALQTEALKGPIQQWGFDISAEGPEAFAARTVRERKHWEAIVRSSGFGDKVLGLPPSHPTFPSLLKAAGYNTALVGKWHLGPPPHSGPRLSGYEEFYGFHSGGADYFAHCDPRGRPDFWENERAIVEEGYLTDLFSRRAVDFIERPRDGRPFMLSLHYNAPHWPWLSRDDQAESVRIGGIGRHVDGGTLATYQRMIHHMDEGIGWVLDALDRQGLSGHTLIVFSSDNGGERYSNTWPLVGQKMDLLEGGLRVPLIARWPERIRAGSHSEVPVITMDWAATFLEAAGVAPDPAFPLDGVSLLPMLDDPRWCPRSCAVLAHEAPRPARHHPRRLEMAAGGRP